MNDLNTYQQARLSRDARFDGTFFVAVKSTGIFCRPICPAPLPMEKNVTYYPLAQLAMQAGYRPCLRCRPDSAPESFAWKGVDTTVERGMRLLRQFPDLPLEEIAQKLGVSDRYFRALFKQKLGIGPKKFQMYEQLLFAKKLLHESSLSVEHVAQACGFSSSRRLQQNMKDNLGLTPKQVRSKTPFNREYLTLQLAYRTPFDWQHIRDFLQLRRIEGMEQVTDNSYARSFNIGDDCGWFRVTHNPKARGFEVQLKLENLALLKTVVGQIRRVLDLDLDPSVVESALLKSGVPASQIKQGIRIPGVWHPFEAGCRAILGQQISVKAAINLVTKLVHNLGLQSEFGYMFPSPEAVANSDLSFLGMPQRRRESIIAFAHYCHANPLNSDLQHWLNIKGVGPWTVAYAQMRGQSNPDIWLDTDLVVKKQLQQFNIDAQLASPWRSYLTFQLWSMA